MKSLNDFLRNEQINHEAATSALFLALGYYLSSEKKAIDKVLTYANKEFEHLV
jgi:hypothetical protein